MAMTTPTLGFELCEIRKAVADVWDTLGSGHSECVYREALSVYLREKGLKVTMEQCVPIVYRNVSVGMIRCDICLENTVVELKAIKNLRAEDICQCKKYMRHLPRRQGVLVNFPTRSGAVGPDIEVYN